MTNKNDIPNDIPICQSTRYTYWRVIEKLAKRFEQQPQELSQSDIDLFIDEMAEVYAPASVNLYRSAINKYYRGINSPIKLKTHTVRQEKRLPKRMLSRWEVATLFDDLEPFYEQIARKIYITPAHHSLILAATPSRGLRGGNVSYRTLSQHFRRVSVDWPNGPAPPFALYVSGVLHALEDEVDWRLIQQATGMAPPTIEKYKKIAKGIPL